MLEESIDGNETLEIGTVGTLRMRERQRSADLIAFSGKWPRLELNQNPRFMPMTYWIGFKLSYLPAMACWSGSSTFNARNRTGLDAMLRDSRC